MKAIIRGSLTCLVIVAGLGALATSSASAAPTITPSGTTAAFTAADFKAEYRSGGSTILTISCSKSTFTAAIDGTTSATIGFSFTVLFCTNSLGCAQTITMKTGQTLTAVANLGSGTYSFGMTLPGVSFTLNCLGGSCTVSISGQTFADATVWTNAGKTLAVSDDTLTWTGTGSCLGFTGGAATVTATYVQTNTPAMVVTGS